MPKARTFPQIAVFQQHGAPLHSILAVRSLLNEMFPSSCIEAYGRTLCPAGSPDLNAVENFRCTLAKDQV